MFQIGWRGFGRESINSGSKVYSLLNTIYPVFIVLLLWYVYIYEIVACQWKLNVKKDTKSVSVTQALEYKYTIVRSLRVSVKSKACNNIDERSLVT